MAQDHGNWWAAVSMIIDPQVPLNVKTLLTSFSKRSRLHGVRQTSPCIQATIFSLGT